MSHYPGWKKSDGKLVLLLTDDVNIEFVTDLEGAPFQARVGASSYRCESLGEAVDWCEQVYQGMNVLLGPEPLEETDLVAAADAHTQFLEERGLRT